MSANTLQKTSYGSLIALCLVAAIALGSNLWQGRAGGQAPAPAIEDPAIQHAKGLSRAFRKAVGVATPSVVQITTRTRARVPRGRRNQGENPFRGTPFEDLFNDEAQDSLRERMRPQSGLGSGVIIDAAGVILTNNHVVENADEVTVELSDGRKFRSSEIKTDSETDLALVRIQGAGSLPVAQLGDSDALEIGDWVLAIGSPFGLERTVSAGIISGKGRGLEQIQRTRFLQTDAAINPGNSGGPLVNIEGEVVGINTAIASSSGGYQGIGFAVPINNAKWVLGQLLARGSVERAYLGVVIGEITPEFAELYKVPVSAGVAVSEVKGDSPAATAGIQQGDVITHFAGKQVGSPFELTSMVERAPLESKQPVRIQRDGEERTIEVVMKAMPPGLLRPRPSIDDLGAAPDSAGRKFTPQEFGFEVGEMNPEAAQRLQTEGKRGVLITSVEPDGAAAENGLHQGDAILRVGKIAVTTVDEFKAALAKQPGEQGLLLTVATPRRIRLVTLSR